MAKKPKKIKYIPELTTLQELQKERFLTLKTQIADLEAQISDCKKECHHAISFEYEEEHWGPEGYTFCVLCDRYFGHYCPNSKDHACHYYSDNGKVELYNGQVIELPSDHNDRYETDDCCLFCGAPEERK